MRRNSFLTFLKEKSFIIVLTLMLVSAGTMAALFSLGGEEQPEEKQTARQEETTFEAPVTDVKAQQEEKPESKAVPKTTVITKKTDTKEEKKEEKKEENTTSPIQEEAALEAELEDQYLEDGEMAEASTGDIIAEGFSEANLLSLKWPVEGDVILEFSMDRSIYFPTLAQYQYNPAMIIGTSEGTEVFTAAAGTVIDVGKSNEYGHYVTMDIGDGFEITYGQLFDVSTEVGETLDAGERIAMVAYPTRSYIEEGDNLYLKLTQDDVPVDPALYLEK